ncbi:hypothetical protein ACS0TY_014360 [Phlomoides rotata]
MVDGLKWWMPPLSSLECSTNHASIVKLGRPPTLHHMPIKGPPPLIVIYTKSLRALREREKNSEIIQVEKIASNFRVPLDSKFGTLPMPDREIKNSSGAFVPNPDYKTWIAKDKRVHSLILSFLTEESIAETIGCPTSYSVWNALEVAFNYP